jgi:hypothetical protein
MNFDTYGKIIMPYLTRNFISPNFTHEKIESASYKDLVDVFEDRIRNWFLMPAERLLEIPHCQIAAVSILITYFEGIAVYLSGKDSKNKSFEFFEQGFSKVFSIQDRNALRIVARAVYDQARCGFAHDGMFRNRLFFSDVPSKALIVSLPKKDSVLNLSHIESIVINPNRFCESIRIHFEGFLKRLRGGSERHVRQAFEAAVKLKWALDESDRAIGMTEEEFFEA